jgi:acetyl esterase/lipase
MDTYTYKQVGDCAIKLDVYPAESTVPTPVIVWIHGGALIFGTRAWVQPVQRQLLHEAGYTQVSIDYRLAPETKLPEIVADVGDALRWLAMNAAKLNIDATRIGVLGRSGGGYLALMAGCCAGVKPKAIASFYGYGDIIGDWYAKPDPYYSKQTLVTESEARAVVGQKELSEAAGETGPNRSTFYLYCRQQGLWPKEVLGVDHREDPTAFHPYCPNRNMTAAYPPTLLLHGTNDNDVPYEQSVILAAALKEAGVDHELVTIEGGAHTFDNRVKAEYLENGERAREVAALYRVVQWIGKYV